jgi:hypothetical protein
VIAAFAGATHAGAAAFERAGDFAVEAADLGEQGALAAEDVGAGRTREQQEREKEQKK